MNTKLLLTSSSLVLGLAGIFTLFAPDALSSTQGGQLSLLIQLMGALYFAFALMNWTAKDSAIGGIYARPVSLGNFSHFFTGALLLIKYQLSNAFNLSVFVVMIVYGIYAIFFYWLVFRATGIRNSASS